MTAFAVVLGVGFVAGTFVLTDRINSSFDKLFSDVNEGLDVIVRSESEFESQLGGSRQPIPDSLIETVAAVDGGAPPLGGAWYDEPQGSLVIREGKAPVGPDQVLVDASTARKQGFEVGERITIITQVAPREFEVSGIAGFGEADNFGGATLATFDLPTSQEVFNKPGVVDTIDVAAEDGVTAAELRRRIQRVLPGGVEAADAQEVAAAIAGSTKDALGFINIALLVFAGISQFVGAFLIFNTVSITGAQRTREFALLRALGAGGKQVTGAFVTFLGVSILTPLFAGPLANFVGSPLRILRMPGKLARRNAGRNPKRTAATALSVFERTRELGLLRAVGMSRRQTRRMIRWEAVVISVIGAVIGLVIGVFFFFGWALVKSLEGEGITELVIPFGQLCIYVVLAAAAGIVAAIFPARRASRLNVLEAISTE
ncbi:hypothetical protein BH23ACT12_BH23ACT12_00850 [soil metagenome]